MPSVLKFLKHPLILMPLTVNVIIGMFKSIIHPITSPFWMYGGSTWRTWLHRPPKEKEIEQILIELLCM